MMPKRKCPSIGKYHFLNQYRVIPGEFRREFKNDIIIERNPTYPEYQAGHSGNG